MTNCSASGSRILIAFVIIGAVALFSGAAWGKPAAHTKTSQGAVYELPELVIESSANESPCEETAALHYSIAESLGLDADAAYEDAIEVCLNSEVPNV